MMDLQDLLKELRQARPLRCLLRSLRANHLHVKGGVPEHRDSGLLLALQPSPSGLDHDIATWHTSDG